MTATTSGRRKCFSDLDDKKNEEWLRRRKLRIEQVRRQSSEMAKLLRQKSDYENKLFAEEYERILESKEKMWRTQRLMELERIFQSELEEVGKAHKSAMEEPDPEEIIKVKRRINYQKAQERGKIAKLEEARRRKMEEETKMCPIYRKIKARKIENLRSALICSVPAQKQHIIQGEKEYGKLRTKMLEKPMTAVHANEVRKKVGIKSKRKKSVPSHQTNAKPKKTCGCKNKVNDEEEPKNTIWINLNEMQSSSETDLESKSMSSRSVSSKPLSEKTDKAVKFYDHPSRYFCKSFKEIPNLVQRIDPHSQDTIASLVTQNGEEYFKNIICFDKPNANELSRIDEEMELEETRRKEEAGMISEERGLEALRREKGIRNYQHFLNNLEMLCKKEKIQRSQQPVPKQHIIYMNDERVQEKTKLKQRLMDSKFEKIFYENTTVFPQGNFVAQFQTNSPTGGGDFFEPREEVPTKLSFSPGNRKTNTPVSLISESLHFSKEPTSPTPHFHQESPQKNNSLLLDIEKALREGRLLRQTVSRNLEEKSNEEKKENKEEELVLKMESEASGGKESPFYSVREEFSHIEKSVKSQEVQTEDITENKELPVKRMEYKLYGGDDSLPVSTCTSYKSPPSVIRCGRLSNFFEYLEGNSEDEENISHPQIKRKLSQALNNLKGINKPESSRTPTTDSDKLLHFIIKLLGMDRESIANLSVSSDAVSTPNVTDLDIKEREEDTDRKSTTSYDSRKSVKGNHLKRSEDLEYPKRNWENVLANKFPERQEEAEDEPDCPTGNSSRSNVYEIHQSKIEKSSRQEKQSGVESEVPLEEDQKGGYIHGEKNTNDKHEEEISAPAKMVIPNNPKTESKYEEYAKKCLERIWQLSNMLDQIRQNKENSLEFNSMISNFGSSQIGTYSDKESSNDDENKKQEFMTFPITQIVCPYREDLRRCSSTEKVGNRWDEPHTEMSRDEHQKKICPTAWSVNSCPVALNLIEFPIHNGNENNESVVPQYVLRYKKTELHEAKSSTTVDDSQSNISSDSIPDIMKELLEKKIITSPFKWTEGDQSPDLTTIGELPRSFSIETSTDNFRKKMNTIRPISLGESERKKRYTSSATKKFDRYEGKHHSRDRDESSVDSISQALTNLGLNWAKTFMKKNEESKAINSSSGSDEEVPSGCEKDGYYY